MTSLYTPTNTPMQVAALMSGSGSNVRKLIEHERAAGNCLYHIAVIFSDRASSNAEQIGKDYHLPVIVHDIREFYQARHKPLRDMITRAEFDQATVDTLKPYSITAAAYAGYMSIASDVLVNAFLGVNVHPADLSLTENGKRIYTGDKAVHDAIMAGETELRATTHLVEAVLDGGRILMISAPVIIPVGTSTDRSDYYQTKLKEIGDWVIFPKTLEYLAQGKFAQDEHGRLYFANQVIPTGVRL